MVKLVQLSTALVVAVLLLGGCFGGQDNVLNEVEKTVKTIFESPQLEPNHENKYLSYYLPQTLTIDQEIENNIVLADQDKAYILFYNPNEKMNSKANYETHKKNNIDDLVLSTFSDEDRFGYVQVHQVSEKIYSLTVGIGGVKMTTEAPLKKLNKSAEYMAELVTSISY